MLHNLVPGGPDLLSTAPEFPEQITELYRPEGPIVRANLVVSANGSMVGDDGTSTPLSFPLDRVILRVIRSHADAVLVGGASVRAEGYSMPSFGALVVVTRTGDLEGHWLGTGGMGKLIVLAPAEAHPAALESLQGREVCLRELPASAAHPGEPDWAATFDLLRAEGLRSLVSEGGPRFTASLMAQGALDELCLTEVRERSSLVVPAPFSVAELPAPSLLLEHGETGARFSRRALR